MSSPILFVVDHDPEALASLVGVLERRFGADDRILTERSPLTALGRLEQARARGDEVALAIADQWTPELTGIECLARVRGLYPRASRCLLVTWGDAAAYPLVRRALTLGQVDTYVLKPWGRPDERLYPLVTELLGGWTRITQPRAPIMRIIGEQWGVRCHEMRDLSRRWTSRTWRRPRRRRCAPPRSSC